MEELEQKKEVKQLPSRTIDVRIVANKFDKTYKVEYPNTGQSIDIELTKVKMARGQYDGLVAVETSASNYARFLIDMIATFSIIIPDLKKDMGIIQISDLDVMDSKKLLKVYIDTVLPWLQNWFDVLNSKDDE